MSTGGRDHGQPEPAGGAVHGGRGWPEAGGEEHADETPAASIMRREAGADDAAGQEEYRLHMASGAVTLRRTAGRCLWL